MTIAILCALVLLTMDFWAISRWKQHTLPEFSGSTGATFGPMTGQYRRPIKSLQPDSPLIAAGARVGDEVTFDHSADFDRYLEKGEQVGLALYREGAGHHTVVAASAENATRDTVAFFFLDWASLIISVLSGMLIAIRRPEPGPQRILCAVLLFNGLGTELWILPNGFFLDLILGYGSGLIQLGFYQSFLLFALVYPENAPPMRHRWVRFAFMAQLLFHVAYALNVTLRAVQLMPAEMAPWLPVGPWSSLVQNITVYGGLAALGYSWWRNTGVTRRKVMWIALGLGVLYLSFRLFDLNKRFLGTPIPNGTLSDMVALARCGATMLLAYALLSRRLFDTGAVINRALLLAIISAFLLVAFAVTEFAVDKLLHFHGRQTNIIIDAAVALGVILSFHRIQHWVNHKINHVFFHQWHEAAEGMREFMASATHISDIAILQRKFIAATQQFADVGRVAIYAVDNEGRFALQHSSCADAAVDIDANDDGMIRLRHLRKHVVLQEQSMFPLLVRGEVRGAVLVGAKHNGDPLRSDEIALLDRSVHQLALDLESLRAAAIERRMTMAETEQRNLSQRVADLECVCKSREMEALALRRPTGQAS